MWIRKHQSCHVFCDSLWSSSAGKEEICCAEGTSRQNPDWQEPPFPTSLILSLLSSSLSLLSLSLHLSLSLSLSLVSHLSRSLVSLSLSNSSLSLFSLSLSLSLSLCVDGNLTVKSSNLLFMTNPIVQSRELGSIAKLWGESANSDGREASVQKGTFSLHVCASHVNIEHLSLKVWQEVSKRQKHEREHSGTHVLARQSVSLHRMCVWKVPRNVLNF